MLGGIRIKLSTLRCWTQQKRLPSYRESELSFLQRFPNFFSSRALTSGHSESITLK
jgi:hypothetical protein